MSGKIYYHNITRNILNKRDVLDFLDDYQEGDQLYYTVGGNAILMKIEEDMFRKMVETWAENTLEESKELIDEQLRKSWQL